MKSRIESFNSNIFIISIFSTTFFFSIFELFDKTLGGREYQIIQVILLIIELLLIARNIRNNNMKIRARLNYFIIPFLILIHYLLLTNKTTKSFDYFTYYILWGLLPFLLSVSLDKRQTERYVGKAELLCFVQGIAAIVATIKYYVRGINNLNSFSIGGETYQTASYIAATSFGIALLSILNSSENQLPFFKSKIWKTIYPFYMIALFITTFLSRGRGGALLLMEYLAIFVVILKNNKKISFDNRIIRYFLLLCLIVVMLYLSTHNEYFIASLKRSFSYLTENGIDFSKTSYRDEIYSRAFNLWKNRPIFGYGPFNYPDESYPHNLFLDFLLTGGLLYQLVGIICFIKILYSIKKSLYSESNEIIIAALSISVITMLMFSGTFYSTPMFWFCYSYYLVMCKKKGTI